MRIFLREISELRQAQGILRRLGVDSAGIGIMAKKMVMRVFVLYGLSVRGANILKQECIAVGGDLALPKEASFLRGKRTDAVMMVSGGQLEFLLLNLRAQPFGLKQLGEELTRVVRSVRVEYQRPVVMGILNVTPDSFSDGGKFFVGGKVYSGAVLRRAEEMIDEGADILDIGGESTGPGSVRISLKEELARVEPVFEMFGRKRIFGRVKVSVDTYKAGVARAAVMAGARMVNDVTALRGDRAMASVLGESDVSVVMMYAKEANGRTTRVKKQYKDVMRVVGDFFEERLEFAREHGIARERVVLDPGMGAFVSGDSQYSFEILRRLKELSVFGLPVLVGTSRKGFLGGSIEGRLSASLGTALVAYMNGASVLRVHDVGETRRALDAAWSAMKV